MASKKKMQQWSKLTKEQKASLYERAAVDHKWVKALTDQNYELYMRIKKLEKEIKKLKGIVDEQRQMLIHTYLIDAEGGGCRRCGKSPWDAIHDVVGATIPAGEVE